MDTTVTRSATDSGTDDIIRLLDQPVSARLCPETSTVKGRRVPTCALIMLSVVGAIGLLAYFVWPHRSDGPQPWKTREIALPNGAGTVYHRDRVVNSFFGKYERRIDINGTLNSGSVWLPFVEQAGSTQGDFVWHETGSSGAEQGPWLEIRDMTADYLIDMREIVLYRMHRIDGALCAVALGAAGIDAGPSTADSLCETVQSDDGPAINISGWARNWSSEHLGMLDRRPRFVPGESVHRSNGQAKPINRKPRPLRKSVTAGSTRCAPPIRNHVLRGPPRLEYIGVVSGPPGPPCRGQPTSPTGPSD